MANPDSTEPGIYEFVVKGEKNYFRKWDGTEWYTNGVTIEYAMKTTDQIFSQDRFRMKVRDAVSVTLVANIDGTSIRRNFQQLDLFQ